VILNFKLIVERKCLNNLNKPGFNGLTNDAQQEFFTYTIRFIEDPMLFVNVTESAVRIFPAKKT